MNSRAVDSSCHSHVDVEIKRKIILGLAMFVFAFMNAVRTEYTASIFVFFF